MAIAATVLTMIVVCGLAVALGLYLAKRLNRLSGRLGVPELTPAQAAAKRRVLRVMGVYMLILVLVGGVTWAATGTWMVAVVVVVALMVVAQVASVGVRAVAYRRPPRGPGVGPSSP
ncbi:MAG: hypothetical protein ACYDC5_13795 [Candidatus Dormibacteria bacterium]